MFGLPPVPQSIQDFAALPMPNDHTQLPPLAVLEGDLVIYEYIAVRARTIADQLDASVTRIRNAIQVNQHLSNTLMHDQKNTTGSTTGTTNTIPNDVGMIMPSNYHPLNNTTSERSLATPIHHNNNNNSNMFMMNHGVGPGGGGMMNQQNSERSYGSKGSRNQFGSITPAQIPDTIRNDMSYPNRKNDNGQDMMSRLASIIHDHATASNIPTKNRNDHTIHQIVSVIQQNADGRSNAENETIPRTIVTAAPSVQYPTTSVPTNIIPNATMAAAASSFSVPLKLPSSSKAPPQQQLQLETNGPVRAKVPIVTVKDIVVPPRYQNSSVSLSSASYYMDGTDDGDMKPAARTRWNGGNERLDDGNVDQLKRHVSDEMSKITNSNESDDRKESAVMSHKAKELEKIKEEARILAQYAEFSRRVLEKKGARTKAVALPNGQNDNEHDTTNTNMDVSTNNALSNVTTSETAQHVHEHIQANTNTEIETRVKELEMIKEQARQIASRTRKLIAEDVPDVLTATQRTQPYTTDELDISSVSDPTMLLELARNHSQGDDIPNCRTNNINVIREEARRIAQYTYQIIAGAGGDSRNTSTSLGIVAAQTNHTDPQIPTNQKDNAVAGMTNNVVNPSVSGSFPTEVVIAKGAEIAEDEARIIAQYEQYSQRMQKNTNSRPKDVSVTHSPNLIDTDTPDNTSPVTNLANDVHESGKSINKQPDATIETPLDRLNSIGQVISEERAKELARIKEEARLLAMQVRRPNNKGVKRLSNGDTATYAAKPPEIDYVLNPDAERSHSGATSKSKLEFVTWKDVIGDSMWVTSNDVGVTADSVLIALAQFSPCHLREDDRSGRYSHLEIGYIGICCKHCFGQAGYGRYFPTTLPSFISSFPSTVVKHILDDCSACPKLIKNTVHEVERVNQRSALRCSTHCGSKGLMHFVWESIRNTKAEAINIYEEQKRLRILQSPIEILSNNVTWDELLGDCDLAAIDDQALVPYTLLVLWGQYQKCISDEADFNRTGRLRAHAIGAIGYCCCYCKGQPYTSGSRFFPSNVAILQQSDYIDRMRTHLTSACPLCPTKVRNAFLEFEANERVSLPPRHGSKKLFYRRIWKRLHNTNDHDDDDDDEATTTNVGTVQLTAAINEADVGDLPVIQEMIEGSIIVTIDERGLVPDAFLVAYGQLKPCRLEQMDKAGWYKDREIGFPGLCCKHCGGRPSSGRYFPKTGDNFLRSSKHSIMRHLIELCTRCPDDVRSVLQQLQHKDAMKADLNHADEAVLGAGKNFHQLLWVRLYKHYNVPHGYYEAIDYSLKAKVKSDSRHSKMHESVSNSTNTPYIKKRKVEYGRSNPHRNKLNEPSNF